MSETPPPKFQVSLSALDEETPVGGLFSSRKSLFPDTSRAEAEGPMTMRNVDGRSLSLRDVQSLFATDTKPLKDKITADPDLFFQSLQAIKLRRGQLVGWTSATYIKRIVKNTSDDSSEVTKIDLLVELHAFSVSQLRELATEIWRERRSLRILPD